MDSSSAGQASSHLPTFIRDNLELLLDEWETFAHEIEPAPRSMSSEELRNRVRELLQSISDDMESVQTWTESEQKSRGRLPENSPELTETARDHAAQRAGHGFNLNELVAEYRALRASVVRHWLRAVTGEVSTPTTELVRFDEALDQSLIESIRRYHSLEATSRDLFVGVLGHDLRNPLGAIAGAAQALRPRQHSRDRDIVDSISRNCDRMSSMLSNLLDFTRTRLGETLPLTRTDADLKEVCELLSADFCVQHSKRDIRVECAGDLRGKWDVERVERMLGNLISNALEHGFSGTPVTIRATGDDGNVTLSVHNHGHEIPRELQRVIFDPLRRAALKEQNEEIARRRPESMGLGLYIAREIALAHGGEILLNSSHDTGTSFEVRLPRS